MAGQQTSITLRSLILWQHYGLVWRHFPNVHSRLVRRSAKAHRLSSQEKVAYYGGLLQGISVPVYRSLPVDQDTVTVLRQARAHPSS